MSIKKLKLVTISAIASVAIMFSFQAQAETVKAFDGNKGAQPKVFDPSYFNDQWVMKDRSKVFKTFRKNPTFVNIIPSKRDYLEAQYEKFKISGDRQERDIARRTLSDVKGVHSVIAEFLYIDQNYSDPSLLTDGEYSEARRISSSHLDEYLNENEENTIAFSSYSDKGLIVGVNVLGLFNYNSYKTMYQYDRDNFENALDMVKERHKVDLKKEADFFLIDNVRSLYAVDIVSDDTFILYNVFNVSSVIFEKSKKQYKTMTYEEMFKLIEKK